MSMNQSAQIVHDVVSVSSDHRKKVRIVGHVLVGSDGLPSVSLPGGDDLIATQVNAWVKERVPLSFPTGRRVRMSKEYAERPLQWQAFHHTLHTLSEGRYHLVKHRTLMSVNTRRPRKKAVALSK